MWEHWRQSKQKQNESSNNMALVQTRLKAAIKAALDADSPINQDNAADNTHLVSKREAFASALATAIIDEIKQATIIYSTGLSTPPGGGVVSGTFTHTIQ